MAWGPNRRLGVVVAGWRTLRSGSVLGAWLVFGLINPFLEECYWRGALLDAAAALGLAWSAIYLCTGSLWPAIISHGLVDLFNLAVPVFMGLYVPPTESTPERAAP